MPDKKVNNDENLNPDNESDKPQDQDPAVKKEKVQSGKKKPSEKTAKDKQESKDESKDE